MNPLVYTIKMNYTEHKDAGSFLATAQDLANPTSNRIYQRIGYKKVADVVEMHFQSN